MSDTIRILDVVDMSKGFMMTDGSLYVQGAEELVEKTDAFFEAIRLGDFNFALVKNDTHFAAEYPLSNEAEFFDLHQEFGTYDHEYAVDINLLKTKMAVYWMLKNEFDMWGKKKDLGIAIENMSFGSEEERRAYQYLFHIARLRDDGSYSYTIPRDAFFDSIVADRKVAVIIGVAEDYCVRDAIKGYLAHGFEVVVLTDLTKGIYDTSIPGGVANWDELVEAHFAGAVKSGQLKTTTSVQYLQNL